MKIRKLVPEDIEELRKIHLWHYRNEFEFPDFLDKFISTFVVTDNEGRIISGGGIRLIAESVIVTDKNFSVKNRRQALYHILDASCFITKEAQFERLHAVTDDELWSNHLIRTGFHPRGMILAINL